MTRSKSLPVLIPSVPGQRWSCHSCGDCCRTLVGHLFDHEREFIQEQSWPDLGAEPVVFVKRRWLLNKRPDGACVFLSEDNRCKIHARFGEAAKPLACRVFPFSIRPVGAGWQASLRFDCPSVVSSKGEPLKHHASWLGELAAKLPGASPVDEQIRLQGRLLAASEEADAVINRFQRLLGDQSQPLTRRLIHAARVTSALHQARFTKVRGKRFAELLDVLIPGLSPGDSSRLPAPTSRQCGMLRQLAYAHAEHVTIAELRSGFVSNVIKRLQQVRRAHAFLKGQGIVYPNTERKRVAAPPPLARGDKGGSIGNRQLAIANLCPTFEAVELIQPADAAVMPDISDLMTRYLLSRLESRSVFGDGYYGWPVFDGLDALLLAMACVGWHARHFAAMDGRDRIEFADIAKALGVVDRAVTRLPALGARAERARIKYFASDDGVTRLLNHYRLTDEKLFREWVAEAPSPS